MVTGQPHWGMAALLCIAALVILFWISRRKLEFSAKPQQRTVKPLTRLSTSKTSKASIRPLVKVQKTQAAVAHHSASSRKPAVHTSKPTHLVPATKPKQSTRTLFNTAQKAAKVGVIAHLGVVKSLFGAHKNQSGHQTTHPKIALRQLGRQSMHVYDANVTSPPPTLQPKEALLAQIPPKKLYNPSGVYGSNPYVKEIGVSTDGSWKNGTPSNGPSINAMCPAGSHIANVQAWYTGEVNNRNQSFISALQVKCDDGNHTVGGAQPQGSSPSNFFATWDFKDNNTQNLNKSSGVNMYFANAQQGPFNALGFLEQDITLDNLQERANDCISSDDIWSKLRCANVYQNVIVSPGEPGINGDSGYFDYTNMGWGLYGPGVLISDGDYPGYNKPHYPNTPNVMICKPNSYLNGVQYTTDSGGKINNIKWSCG